MNKDIILKAGFLKIVVIVLAALVLVFLIFSAGIFVGARKARFACAWGDAYHRNFGAPNKEFPLGPNIPGLGDKLPEMNDREFMNPNGVFGKIIKITKNENSASSSEMIISGLDGLEQNVLVANNVNIKLFRDDINFDQLKADQYVAVIGDTDSTGQINAKLIRVIPAPNRR